MVADVGSMQDVSYTTGLTPVVFICWGEILPFAWLVNATLVCVCVCGLPVHH